MGPRPPEEDAPRRGPSALRLSAALIVLGTVIAVAWRHIGDVRHFIRLAEAAQPAWLVVAVVLQGATYVLAGAVLGLAAGRRGHRLRRRQLARLAVERLSVNQLLPTGGMAGSLLVIQAMGRMGVASAVAGEALIVDVLTRFLALAVAVGAASVTMAALSEMRPSLVLLLSASSLVAMALPAGLLWMLHHPRGRSWRALRRVRALRPFLEVIAGADTARIEKLRSLAAPLLLQLGVVFLDAATLAAVLEATGTPVSPLHAFVAVVVATMTAMVSLLPGGIGGFEAGCTVSLHLAGVPLPAALTATLLFRGLTLWLPLLPGAILARQDLRLTRRSGGGPKGVTSSAPPDRRQPLAALLAALATDEGGLTSENARSRSSSAARVASPTSAVWAREIVRAILSPLSLVLLAASLTSAIVGERTGALIIAAMVLLSAGIDLWQTSRSSRAVAKLRDRLQLSATVRRDGQWASIPVGQIVVGDLLRLAAGDLVPADARLVTATDLHVQQALLTGESLPVQKQAVADALPSADADATALVFMGTSIVSGTAEAAVVATGADTSFGEIAARLAARPEETEFDRGTRRFGRLILDTVLVLVLLLLVAAAVMGRDPLTSLLFAVALAVGLTPEYLPVMMTVTLAQGAVRMARQKVIVKHLAAIQNLGSADVLCCDKTGTLTTGRMSLRQAFDAQGRPSRELLELAALNSALETGVKSALDDALLEAAGPLPAAEKLGEVPFDADRRILSVGLRVGGRRLLVVKGAPESMIVRCSDVDIEGRAVPLTPERRDDALRRFEAWSGDGLRVIAVAFRPLTPDEPIGHEAERDLVWAGLISFADPPVEGVDEVLHRLASDGIRLKILSGDNEIVTRTLCREVGLGSVRVATGQQIARLSEAELAHLAEEVDVFARVSPAEKQRIVMALKHRDHVVAFMGDGVNDAPALHAADVGISAAGAVDVAREAADIVLLEKRLDVLHGGILAGRRSFANVQKYLLMGTSSNFGNILSMAAAFLFLPFLPLLPTQILVNNFLYDMAQVGIPIDRVDDASLKRPQRWSVAAIRRFMLFMGPVSSLFDLLTFGALLFWFRFGERGFQTGWFVESLATQVLVVFVIRTAKRPWRDRPSGVLVASALTAVLVAFIIPFTPVGALLGMGPLPVGFLLFVAVIVPTYLFAVELLKRRALGDAPNLPQGPAAGTTTTIRTRKGL